MELAKARYANSLPRADHDSSLVVRFTRIAHRLISFLRPLAILGPTEKVPESIFKGRGKDYNLTLVAVAYGFTVALTVSVLKCIINHV